MKLLSLLIPQTIYKTTSQFSGEIKVIDHVFERRLVVGGLTQSGGILKRMWEKALQVVSSKYHVSSIKNVLILGFGAGTVAQVIGKKFPDAKLTGVEIDPVVIDIGKKYFQLDKIKNLKIVITDAVSYVNNSTIQQFNNYDVIIVDLYKGYAIEKNVQNEQFLQKMAQLLAKSGIVIFNVISSQNNNFKAKIFLDKLRKIFQHYFCKRIISNDFFFCTMPRKTGQAITKGGDTVHGKEKKEKE